MIEKISQDSRTFYGVVNSDGEYWTNQHNFTKDFSKARLYNRPTGARAQITYFKNRFPERPNCLLLVVQAIPKDVIDERERLERVVTKIEQRKQERLSREEEQERLLKQHERIQKRLEELGKS